MTTGTVSSSNLTSLYSNTTNFTAGVVNSSVYSVNGGTGVIVNPTTGNVVVNIGQDVSTSASVQFANVTATGNLSNNYYTLTNAVGIAGQVLTTNGLGVTTWTTPSSLGLVSSVSGTGAGISVSPTTGAVVVSNTGVTSIVAGTGISVSGATGAVTVNATGSNTTYNIDASTVSGGANFNLVGSDATTDTIKFASAGGTTITRTDANTITISSTGSGGAISLNDLTDVILTAPLYDGQLLSYRGSDWINDQRVSTTLLNERSVFEFRPLSPTAGPNSSLFLRKNYSNSVEGTPGVGTFANGAGTGIGFQVASDTQGSPAGTAQTMGTLYGIYDTTNPYFILNTTIDNGANFIPVATISGTDVSFDGTTLTLDANNTGTANNSSIVANRGSSGTDASLTWTESTGFWVFNKKVFGTDEIIATNQIGTNGGLITFNNDDVAAFDCNLQVRRGASPDVSIKWNEATQRWQDTFDGTTYYDLPNQNLDTTSDVNFSSITVDSQAALDTSTLTTTSTGTPLVLNTTGKNAVTGLINIIQGTNVHCLNYTVLRTGASTAMLTTYAEMYNNIPLGNFTADVSGGNLRLLVNPTSATSTVFSVVRTSLT